MRNVILFSAQVGGQLCSVPIDSRLLAKWSLEWIADEREPTEEELDSIESHVMNIEPLYRAFYDGADVDLELVNRSAEVV